MRSRRRITRSIVLPLILAATAWTEVGSARKFAGFPRLISFERLPDPDATMCELEPTPDTEVAAFQAFQPSVSGQAAGTSDVLTYFLPEIF